MREERDVDGSEREWKVLGASRGEGGILGEGVRQALLRDPTYGPALRGGPRALPGMSVSLEVVEDPARACAAMLVSAAIGGGDIVLAGGSTPRAAYEEFVRAVRRPSAWTSAGRRFWFGDERCVPPEDERSNYRMIKETLLDPLGAPQPADGAADQGRARTRAAAPRPTSASCARPGPARVRSGAARDRSRRPHRVAVPGPATLSERERLVVGVPEAGLEPFVPRISLTLPALTAARPDRVPGRRRVQGRRGRRGVRPWSAEPDPQVPASLLAPAAKLITVLLDRAAASRARRREVSG